MVFKRKVIIFFSLFFLVMFVFLAKPIGAQFGMVNPLSGSATESMPPEEVYGRILKAVFGIVGVLSLVFFIWGGFLWMTAGGNQEKVRRGRDTLLWSILGLAAIFASYAILNAAINVLVESTIQ